MIIFEQKKTGLIVTIVLVLLTILQLSYYYPLLPDRIASHYDLRLEPDRWSDKKVALFLNLGIVIFIALLFQCMNWLIYKLPASSINLPHKDYWLAPERKKQTLDSLASFFVWLGNVTLLLITIVFNLIYQANISPSGLTSNFWFAVVVYFITVIYMIYQFYRRFQRVPPMIKRP